MNKQLLNRREFSGLCVALGSSFFSVGTMIVVLPSASARAATRMVKFHDGTIVPALGQGSAGLAQGRRPDAAEEEALRTGLSLGMTLIDTAEMYGDGRSERLIGRVIAGQRDRVFLVSKVWPNHVMGNGIARACDASLARSTESLAPDHGGQRDRRIRMNRTRRARPRPRRNMSWKCKCGRRSPRCFRPQRWSARCASIDPHGPGVTSAA
jgi:Aldo/keto reductase family